MKRQTLFFFFLLSLLFVPLSVRAYDFQSGDLCYNITSSTAPYTVEVTYSYGGYSNLTTVTIPETITYNGIAYSVTSIGYGAFTDCAGLTSVTISNSVTSIGAQAFDRCKSLTSATIPNSVTNIGHYTFNGCTGLTSVTIPNSVTSIGDGVFNGCTGLTSIIIESGNSVYDSRNNCNAIIETATNTLIAGCQNSIIPNSVTSIGESAFSGCSGLTFVTIPNNVTSIGKSAFIACKGLTSVTIGNSVTSIGESAFSGCSSLTSVTIPNSVTSIGERAFIACKSLTSVAIGNSVTSIGEYAFFSSSGMKYISCEAVTPPTCGKDAFYRVPKDIPVYLCNSTVEAYQNAEEWKDFTNLREELYTINLLNSNTHMGAVEQKERLNCAPVFEFSAIPEFGYHFVRWSDGNTDNPRTVVLTQDTTIAVEFAKDYSGKCGNDLYWQYKDTELKISGTGAMYGYTEEKQPWLLFADSIRTITTDNTTTSIGAGAFANLGKLTKLHLGAGIETVGANAFAGCSRLSTIYSYATLPPLAEESSFVNYNARLYVPCEALEDYKFAMLFGNFKNIECIGSDGVTLPSDDVVVIPSDDDAIFQWPSNPNANAYSLVITKDGVVFCTLLFNANGQLTGIAFAPARDHNNARRAAQATVNGWQFTVTGLSAESDYAYTITVTDKSDKVLQSYEGTFTTLGEGELPDGLNTPTESATNVQKVLRDGQVLIERGGKLYTLTGQEIVNN